MASPLLFPLFSFVSSCSCSPKSSSSSPALDISVGLRLSSAVDIVLLELPDETLVITGCLKNRKVREDISYHHRDNVDNYPKESYRSAGAPATVN